MYCRIILLYSWNWNNVVNQLYSNVKQKVNKNTRPVDPIASPHLPQDDWLMDSKNGLKSRGHLCQHPRPLSYTCHPTSTLFSHRCSPKNGQCDCCPHVTGRSCTEPAPGYFFASLNFYLYEAEEATPLQGLAPLVRISLTLLTDFIWWSVGKYIKHTLEIVGKVPGRKWFCPQTRSRVDPITELQIL